jgi:hypothetical protein
MAERNASFGQVVGGDFNGYPVTDGDPDEMFTHFTGDVREDAMSV